MGVHPHGGALCLSRYQCRREIGGSIMFPRFPLTIAERVKAAEA
jgi:hypothetical protein